MIRAALFVIACAAALAQAVSIDLTPAQLTSIAAQQGGAPPPVTPPVPPVVPPVTPPTPPPQGGISCPGFTNTIVVDLDWTRPGRTIPSQTMGANDVIVARFTTGNIDSPDNNLPTVSGAEWDGPPSGRYAVLSDKPCDFAAQEWPGASSAGNSVQTPFAVGRGSNWFYYVRAKKNTTYYFNVRNLNQQQSCMAQGICGMFIELSHSSGV